MRQAAEALASGSAISMGLTWVEGAARVAQPALLAGGTLLWGAQASAGG